MKNGELQWELIFEYFIQSQRVGYFLPSVSFHAECALGALERRERWAALNYKVPPTCAWAPGTGDRNIHVLILVLISGSSPAY